MPKTVTEEKRRRNVGSPVGWRLRDGLLTTETVPVPEARRRLCVLPVVRLNLELELELRLRLSARDRVVERVSHRRARRIAVEEVEAVRAAVPNDTQRCGSMLRLNPVIIEETSKERCDNGRRRNRRALYRLAIWQQGRGGLCTCF
jgi:hypothetical protein